MRLPLPAFAALSLTLLPAAMPAVAAPKTNPLFAPSARRQAEDLLSAANEGNTSRVRALLDAGVSANRAAPSGPRPLLFACMMNHPATVKLLLERGADPNAGDTRGVVSHQYVPLVMTTSLSTCILAGAKVPAESKGYGIVAWSKGYEVIVRLLLDHGADVNAQMAGGMTAVGNAAASGELDTVRLLLERGARLDLPVHEASYLFPGKTLDATNGYLALARPTFGRYTPEMVKLLLTHGASPNAKITDDMTPLGRASEIGDAEPVRLLLAAGADVNAVDASGDTALRLARQGHHAAVVALLLGAGAKDRLESAPLK